jgi:hypothetical protein
MSLKAGRLERPVASMAMCVAPREPGHSDKARRPLVVVVNVRTALHLGAGHAPRAGDHAILVDIEAGAVGIENFHDESPYSAPPAWRP